MPEPASERTRVCRGADRGVYDPDEIRQLLAAGLMAHVGVQTSDGPLVLPMAYGIDADRLYLHGAAANQLLASGVGHEVCVTVTHLDGLVMARAPFHNSMNYRAVVVRGEATRVDEPAEKLRALQIITDHVVENWDAGRPPNDSEVRRTAVLEMHLAESSAKIRSGDPVDEPEDLDGPWWSGVVPVTTSFGTPIPAADLQGESPVPAAVAALEAETVDGRLRGAAG
jgi:nitroimidazol reductase NimA-like FMN-containing flavoprotein (pyridoxamine 5'-phosphate oxidase superfamily)